MSVAVLVAALVAPVANVADAADGGRGHHSSRDNWKSVSGNPAASHNGHRAEVRPHHFRAFSLDRSAMKADLASAPSERATSSRQQPPEIALPAPGGEFVRFAIEESPVMEAGLAAKHPEIKTYSGRSIDDPSTTIRFDLTPLGFHASVRGAQGSWYIDPYYQNDQSLYVSYYRDDLKENQHGPLAPSEDDVEGTAALRDMALMADDNDVMLRTYRLALASDPTYATYFGADNVTAAKVILMNRVNHIYETETAIRMVLVNDNDKLNFNTVESMTGANGACGSAACYTATQVASCGSGTLSRNRIVIGQIIGASNYDIGHIAFGLSGGGIASLGVVGGNSKAQGCTGLPNPVGDYYAIDYVAHEMGHQFAGNHTFNGTQSNCSGGNRSAATSVEPGSGSSIMAYAGICQQDNTQPHSDPYWSQRSYQEITAYTSSTRAAISAVQTVSLRGFTVDGADFRVTYDGNYSAPIVRGVNYTTAGIKAAIEGMPNWPTGGTVAVVAFGGSGTLNDTGFQVTFGGTLASQKVSMLGLANMTDWSGFVGETAKGGPIDNQGYTVTHTGNHAPVVTVPSSFTIPYRTPFQLTGSAIDPDGDTLTYLWEQNDRGLATGTALVNNTKTNGPLFRVFGKAANVSAADALLTPAPGLNLVTTNPTRVFPDLEQIVAGNTNAATGTCPDAPPAPTALSPELVECYSEFLPTSVYTGPMHFRLTARDGRVGGGGIGFAETTVNLAPGTGPFQITSVGNGGMLEGASTQTITWDVAGTDVAPIGTTNVKIRMSTDGGASFPYTLAENAPNNGSATVRIPNVETSKARVMVEAVGNIFFDVSHVDVAVHANPEITIVADVLPGALAMQVGTQQVTMPPVQLSGFDQVVSGVLGEVTVMDGRGSGAGWTVTGQVSDFVGPNGVIVADNLGWSPTGSVISGTLPVAIPQTPIVTPGPLATPGAGTGLRDARTLCGSPAGNNAGAATCGGALSLGIPGSTKLGTYTGVLTLTLT